MKRASTVSRTAFTLLELLVALVVGVLVVEAARRIIEALADSHAAIRREATALDSRLNGEMLLRALVRQMQATSSADTILGDEREVRFTSHCETAFGWSERCRVTVKVGSSDARLIVHVTEAAPFDGGFRNITGPILYLDQSGDLREWKSQPGDRVAALGIVRQRDTLLLPVVARE